MRFSCLPFVILLLSSCYLSVGTSETEFTALNADVLLLIFNHLSLSDHLNLVRAIPQITSIAAASFRLKYKNYEFVVRRTNETSTHTIKEPTEWKFFETLAFKDAEDMLRTFGSVLSKLTVVSEQIEQNDSTPLMQLVNEYCSKSLTQLDLRYLKEDMLQHLTVPFLNVESLYLDVNGQRIENGALTSNRLFPRVKQLTIKLDILSECEYDFINYEFRELERLIITCDNNLANNNYNHLNNFYGSFLRKNSQIRFCRG